MLRSWAQGFSNPKGIASCEATGRKLGRLTDYVGTNHHGFTDGLNNPFWIGLGYQRPTFTVEGASASKQQVAVFLVAAGFAILY